MQEASYQLYEESTGRIIVPRLEMARTLWKQTIGLLGRDHLALDAGIWLEPCNSIHTFGMRFALDVLFIDRSGTLIHIVEHVKPWRICWPVWRARIVIELPEGAVALRKIQLGKRYICRNS